MLIAVVRTAEGSVFTENLPGQGLTLVILRRVATHRGNVPKYPHMSPGEEKLWERYLSWCPYKFVSLTYDLHLGDSAPLDPTWEPWLVNLVLATSRKRVDAIGKTSSEIIIYEVKEYAGMNALGQLLAYESLYRDEYHPVKPIKKTVITDRLPPSMEIIFPQFNIEVVLV